MKKLVLVLLALAACKTPTADAAAPQAQPAKTEAAPTPVTPAPEKAAPKLLVAIERTPCFGRCPIYRAEVFDDGTLVFDGRRFTAVRERTEVKLTEQRLHELVARVEQSDFAKWKPSYEHRDMTDMPSTFVTFRDKTIRHYQGDKSAPMELTGLEYEIELLLDLGGMIHAPTTDQ